MFIDKHWRRVSSGGFRAIDLQDLSENNPLSSDIDYVYVIDVCSYLRTYIPVVKHAPVAVCRCNAKTTSNVDYSPLNEM